MDDDGGEAVLVDIDRGFEQHFHTEYASLVTVALVMTGSREAAADLAQDAFARTYANWATVRFLDRPGAWTRRVVINLAIDWLRRNERERRAMERMGVERPTASISDPMGERFWSAVRALPERQRAAVALHYLEDMSVDQVAATLGVRPGTVKASLFRARAILSNTMAQEVD